MTVKYGAHNKSASVFDIIVDNTPASGIKANTVAKSLTGLPANMAVVGKGTVNLTWNEKSSGINFTNVTSKFYEMQLEVVSKDPNSDRNYFSITEPNLAKITNLYSAYKFATEPSVPNNGYEPIKTANGWTLNETFDLPGIYVFTFFDEVGNETEFILIIDQSASTFVQSGAKNDIPTNAVNFDENVGVYIGFGINKLIAGNYSVFESMDSMLTDAGVLVENNRSGLSQSAIKIGVSRVEYSKSGEKYQDVSRDDLEKGYIILKEEGTFYFRVTDNLGNMGEYYIVLTHDNSFGTVYADAVRPIFSMENSGADRARGIIADEANINTSLVTSNGGMTNRDYVSFSFQQKEGNFNVKEIYLQYYPFTYDVNALNYPFADKPVNNPIVNDLKVFAYQASDGVIYQYEEGDEERDTIRLALFNLNTTTPSGMYVITRVYSIIDQSQNDPKSRDYYFIVDDQKMLHYDKDKYQTKLKVEFANERNSSNSKIATAGTIYRNNNQLSSDRTAWVTGFTSKYSYKHGSTEYTFNKANTNFVAGHDNVALNTYRFNFPSLTPRFSYVHNFQTYELGAGKGVWAVGDPASASDSTIYKLLIRDDARNISCMLVNGGVTELIDQDNAPTSANYDYLTLDLELGHGTKAEIQISDSRVISNAQMQYDGERYYYITDPDELDELKFSFKSDSESMYTDVDLTATMATWTAEGFLEPFALQLPSPVNGKYTFDLMASFLDDV